MFGEIKNLYQKKKGIKRGQNFFVYDLVTGCFRRHTHTHRKWNILRAAARCCLLARLPVMRLWQRQRVVYVMAAETFHRRDSLRRACCQIVCENKTKETKRGRSSMRKRASKTVLNFCQGHWERAARRVSHYFSYSTEIASRDTLIKMCTHLSRFWLSPGHAHTPHTHPRARSRPAISVAKRQNRKMPPFPAPSSTSSSQAASIIIIRQQNSPTSPAN